MTNIEARYVDTLVLRDQSVVHVNKDFISHLVSEKYRAALPEHLIDQLIAYSTDLSDASIQQYTRDANRFNSKEAIEIWLTKGRTIYTLTDPPGDTLYGISWIGKEPLPENGFIYTQESREQYSYTWAKRLYGDARGKKLSLLQTQMLFEDFFLDKDYDPIASDSGIWETVSLENASVIRVDLSLGFQQIGEEISGNKIILATTIEDLVPKVIT